MKLPYTYWQDPKDGVFVGYWLDYPDHWTQGHTLSELEFMLRDLRTFIDAGDFDEEPRKIATMEYA